MAARVPTASAQPLLSPATDLTIGSDDSLPVIRTRCDRISSCMYVSVTKMVAVGRRVGQFLFNSQLGAATLLASGASCLLSLALKNEKPFFEVIKSEEIAPVTLFIGTAFVACAVQTTAVVRNMQQERRRAAAESEEKAVEASPRRGCCQGWSISKGFLDLQAHYGPVIHQSSFLLSHKLPNVAYMIGVATTIMFIYKEFHRVVIQEQKRALQKPREITKLDHGIHLIEVAISVLSIIYISNFVTDKIPTKIIKDASVYVVARALGRRLFKVLHHSQEHLSKNTKSCCGLVLRKLRIVLAVTAIPSIAGFFIYALDPNRDEGISVKSVIGVGLLGLGTGFNNTLLPDRDRLRRDASKFKTGVPSSCCATCKKICSCRSVCALIKSHWGKMILVGFAAQDIAFPSKDNVVKMPYQGAISIASGLSVYMIRGIARRVIKTYLEQELPSKSRKFAASFADKTLHFSDLYFPDLNTIAHYLLPLKFTVNLDLQKAILVLKFLPVGISQDNSKHEENSSETVSIAQWPST